MPPSSRLDSNTCSLVDGLATFWRNILPVYSGLKHNSIDGSSMFPRNVGLQFSDCNVSVSGLFNDTVCRRDYIAYTERMINE